MLLALAPDLADTAIRLSAAAALGAIVGLEREVDAQSAGVRTHAILALGSALAMLVALDLSPAGSDPGRIAAQVVSGIGFLGAGAILRLGTSVRGLTTAASLWAVAAIGLAAGAGYFAGALLTTFLVLGSLHLVERVVHAFGLGRTYRLLRCTVGDRAGCEEELASCLRRFGILVRTARVRTDLAAHTVELHFNFRMHDDASLEAVARAVASLPDVRAIELE